MRDTTIIESNKSLQVIKGDFIRRELFPEVFNISDLITDYSLPLLQLIDIEDNILTTVSFVDIKFQLPITEFPVDLFLFINNKKYDMYYQIFNGEYSFHNIHLNLGKNLFEIFYKHKSKKSTSIFLNVNYEKKV